MQKALRRAALQVAGKTVGRTSWGRRTVFAYIHRSNHWGSHESISGPGSELEETAALRSRLPALLEELQVHTLIDIPCGDLGWLRKVQLPIDRYYGFDIVPELVERLQEEQPIRNGTYMVADMVKARLPKADAILCRDAFLHLPFRDVIKSLDNFKRSGSRYLLASTYVGVTNIDLPAGRARPLDLTKAPFNLPSPVVLVDEEAPQAPGKHLGVWELAVV